MQSVSQERAPHPRQEWKLAQVTAWKNKGGGGGGLRPSLMSLLHVPPNLLGFCSFHVSRPAAPGRPHFPEHCPPKGVMTPPPSLCCVCVAPTLLPAGRAGRGHRRRCPRRQSDQTFAAIVFFSNSKRVFRLTCFPPDPPPTFFFLSFFSFSLSRPSAPSTYPLLFLRFVTSRSMELEVALLCFFRVVES